jgi:hypothetical protein
MIKIPFSLFKKKIHIFYRHVHVDKPSQKMRPDWFSFERCFRNLISSIEKSPLRLKIDLVIMFDGDEKYFQKDFLSSYMNQEPNKDINIELFKFLGGSDGRSFHKTLDYALEKNYSDNDLIYFLENDYLHVFDWIEKLHTLLMSAIPFDYLSLYDHKDKYEYTERFHDSHAGLTSKLYVTEDHHWRTTPSTCASFILSAKTLREDFLILKNGGMDHQFFLILLRDKNRKLLSPVPGLSTHVMSGLMSPLIDWEKISNEAY